MRRSRATRNTSKAVIGRLERGVVHAREVIQESGGAFKEKRNYAGTISTNRV